MDVEEIEVLSRFLREYKYKHTANTFTDFIALLNDEKDCQIYRTGSCQECKHNKLCTIYEDVINWM